MLELADQLVAARSLLRSLTALDEEIARQRLVAERAPEIAEAVSARRAAIEAIARELEQQWVAQGPLVALWQRAVELAELAEGSGADPAEYRAEVDEARLRVETERLATRETIERLCNEREALADDVLSAPFDLPLPAAVRDDGRPEAGRRDALGLIEVADAALAIAAGQGLRAHERIDSARLEQAELGSISDVESRIAELRAALPESIDLPPSSPPSAGMRLQRAGVAVTAATLA
ncbi:MAG: hypothetical protein QOG33_385 [Gaiellales bacterium]|jgi:hypothetical protein|nr:hypothetical protein [Gaiellales bacterium]